MPMIPAFCDNCGQAFPSGIFLENCQNVTMSGSKSGPCPKCGGMGTVLDGVFNVTERAIEVLSAPDWTLQRLQSLATIVKEARKSGAPPENVAKQLKEEAPELSSLADVLPKTRKELYAALGILLGAISIISKSCEGPVPPQAEQHAPDSRESGEILNGAIQLAMKGEI